METIERNPKAGQPDYLLTTLYLNRRNFGLKPKIGVLYSPYDQWSIGLTVGKQFRISGSGDAELRQFPTLDAAGTPVTPNVNYADSVTATSLQNVSSARVAPVELTLGQAFFFSPSFLVAADFFLYTPDPQFTDWAVQTTWNAAVGLEWHATPKTPLRFGLFTNNSNTAPVAEGGTDQTDHVNQYGVSTGFSFVGQQSSITLSGNYTYGAGKSQIVGNSVATQALTQQSLTVYLSASYQL